MTFAGTALMFVLLATAANAQDFGPDTCVSGFVWREAFPGDRVCVDPAVRGQVAVDNRLAAARREPGGGPYGPDTCRPGFVWREARPNDRVCVTPQTRSQTASDNQAASSRRAPAVRAPVRPEALRNRGALLGARSSPPSLQAPPPRPESGSESKRGFDDNGEPYVEDTLSDGSLRREQRNGVTVIKPDGTSQFFPPMTVRANVQPPTPPDLPDDPALGRAWVGLHNEQLLALISRLVRGDQSEMQKFTDAEARAAGSDLFRQVEYRTRVLDILARP